MVNPKRLKIKISKKKKEVLKILENSELNVFAPQTTSDGQNPLCISTLCSISQAR